MALGAMVALGAMEAFWAMEALAAMEALEAMGAMEPLGAVDMEAGVGATGTSVATVGPAKPTTVSSPWRRRTPELPRNVMT